MFIDDEYYPVFIYDCEVFAHDWLFTFKDEFGNYRMFWNNREDLESFLQENQEALFVGFNSSHYDQWILKAILAGGDPQEVKEVNDFIIEGGEMPWEHPLLSGFFYDFNDVDLMKDTQMGISLKAFEAHSGMSIEESSVDFTINHPLTPGEKVEVERYCKHDVDATETLFKIRLDYLYTKAELGGRAGLEPPKAMAITNAKLSARVLDAKKLPHDDERDYVYPNNLLTEYIPVEVFLFFDRFSVKDYQGVYLYDFEEIQSSKLEIDVGGCPITLGLGGIHGALPKWKGESKNGRVIINADVASYYPSLMIFNHYCSRNMSDPKIFEDIYWQRIKAKAEGDKQTANALKLIVNSTYGATLNQYNDLYDPLMARSVCISGQLYLLELACHLNRAIDGLKIVQLNTDGIMVDMPESGVNTRVFESICAEWTERTKFVLEFDNVDRIWQKDVNNYAMRLDDGKEKIKGGYLVRGIAKAGAFNINNNATIVAEALREFLLNDKPVEETILNCDDPKAFQLIAKASGKYSRVYQYIDSTDDQEPTTVDLQRCNRVFSSKDKILGKLLKVKKENGQVAKIENLPDHCLISNKGFPDIKEIDKDWYVSLAQKRASDFIKDESEDETMTTRQTKTTTEKIDWSTKNVWQKLIAARRMFLDENVKKSGVNRHLEFEYYQLDDIVPPQTRIFEKVGLLELFTQQCNEKTIEIDDETHIETISEKSTLAKCTVVNVDKPSEKIDFYLDWNSIPPQKNRNGEIVSNPAQDEGKTQTYLRRYLKMQVLDICESDALDHEIGKDAVEPTAKPKPASKPSSSSERQQIAKQLTNSEGAATKLQITQLKKQLKKMKETYGEKHPDVNAFIAKIGVETNNLADVTKSRCEEIIQELGEIRESFEKGE